MSVLNKVLNNKYSNNAATLTAHSLLRIAGIGGIVPTVTIGGILAGMAGEALTKAYFQRTNPILVLKHSSHDWAAIEKDGFNAPHNEASMDGLYFQEGKDLVSFGAKNQKAYHKMVSSLTEATNAFSLPRDYKAHIETRAIEVRYNDLYKIGFTSAQSITLFGKTTYGKGIEAVVSREYVNAHLSEFIKCDTEDQNDAIMVRAMAVADWAKPISLNTMYKQTKTAMGLLK